MNKVELLRKIYSDFEAVPPNLHPDFKLYSPGNSPIAGEFDGLDGLTAHLSEMQELTDNGMTLDAHTFLADENWGLGISHVTGERNGKKLDVQGFGVWRFQDGKLIEHWECVNDQQQWDDFWS